MVLPRTTANQLARQRREVVGKVFIENIGGVEAVTRMVVAADGSLPTQDDVQIGRRLTPLSLPRLKFMERPIDNQ